ncbi:MAG TPA: serine/threonine-protein kinase [Terriglobales bacterium]|nr:serine/threonine-protein kinase [Terriglobales bacterium]
MTTLHQSLGRYLIEAEIGRGAMGVVYRAYDPQIGRTVAIKTISLNSPDFPDEEEYRQRFFREARAAGRLLHSGIVTIFDAGEDGVSGEPYLVMEYIAGEPLSKVLSRSRKLSLSAALQFAQEIAEALDYAHTQGVVHRDIKPQNILITEDGHAKITDFGVAWLNQEMSQAGEIVGSPAFMAPEQMAGKQADARSDLFSLGVVLYTMLTGFRPFQGNSAKTVVFKVMNIEPIPVASFQSDIPPELNAIVSRAIAKNPDERYPSGAALVRALQAFRLGESTSHEELEFFTRAVEGDTKNRESVVSKAAPARLLLAAITTLVVAASIFAWRMSKKYDVPLPPEVVAEVQMNRIQKLASTAPHPANTSRAAHVLPKLPARRPRRASTSPTSRNDAPVGAASLRIEIQHHLNGAKASIWFDDNLVSTQNLSEAEQRHSLLRTVEVDQVTNFKLSPGKHSIQVRVVSPANKYDQIETLDADLGAGSDHVLLVYCDKRKLNVTLQ